MREKGVNEEAQRIYRKYAPEEIWDTEDMAWYILNILPDLKIKGAVGIIKRHDRWSTATKGGTLHAIMPDGKEREFKYRQVKMSPATELKKCLRREVDYVKVIPPQCYALGKTVGHHMGRPFDSIAREFIAERNLTLEDTTWRPTQNGGKERRLREVHLKDWLEFHDKHGVLVYVSPEEHKIIHARLPDPWK